MSDTRLSVAAHPAFPGRMLDGAMPTGADGLLIASGMTDFGRALLAAERDNSEALLLFTPAVEEVVELLRASRTARPDMALIVAVPGPLNGEIGQALTAGADELVILPAESSVVASAVHKAMARVSTAVAAAADVQTHAPLVAVLGPKGGVGKTTVSVNLATDLAARGHRTLIVDLDLQFGDVGVVLGIEPERTIYDLAVAPGKLDAERLHGFLAESGDGVHALLAPVRPDQAEAITTDRLEHVLRVARGEFDVVVVDTPPAFTATTIVAVDQADVVVMVGALDLPGLKNMKVGLETLDLMGVAAGRVVPVLNRADSKVGLLQTDVRTVLSRPPEVLVPSDRAVPRSVNAARPLVASDPKSAPARSLRTLGDRVVAAVLQPKDA